MDILGQSALLLSLSSFAIGLAILARNIRNKLFISFCCLCLLVSFWSISFFFDQIWVNAGFYRAHLVFNIWLAPAALFFIRLMIRIQDRASRRLLDFSFLAALLLSGCVFLELDRSPWIRMVIYFAPTPIVIQTLQLIFIDRKIKSGLRRIQKIPTMGLGVTRRLFIYLGALVVLSISSMDHVPAMGTVIPSLGNLALIAYLFLLGQAISHQRLLNLNALLTRFLVLLVIALVLTGIYLILFAWIEDQFPLFFLNSFFISFVLVMLLDPLRSLVTYCTQRLGSKENLRVRRVLREGEMALSGVVDLDSFSSTVMMTVEQIMNPQRAALYLLDSEGTRYQRLTVIGSKPGKRGSEDIREILADHPVVEYTKQLRRRGDVAVLLDQIIENEIDRSASKTAQNRLRSLNRALRALSSNLLIPIFDGEKILGFLAMYVPSPPEPWGNNWGVLPLLDPFFSRAAQALKSLEIYVLQRKKDRLAELGEMAAGLAHEIRNPLGAIKGAAQYLDPSADRPDSRFLKVIVEEVDRLNHVVTQFLDYSKPAPPQLEKVNLSALVEKTVENLRPGLQEGRRLVLRRPRLNYYVRASAVQIQQLLINLIQNSLEAFGESQNGVMTKGLVSVSVDQKKLVSGPHVVVQVEDNGPGISKEHLDKLFIPFFTTSSGGTGLGLSICQKIVENHEGHIEVESDPGVVTRFRVHLPLLDAKDSSMSDNKAVHKTGRRAELEGSL